MYLTPSHHSYPASVVYIRVHSWCCTFYGFEQMYNDMYLLLQSVSSVAQSCPTLCDPMDRSMPGLPVHHHLLEFTQTHVHWVGDAIQPPHPLSSPSPPAPNSSKHQSLFQWVNCSHEVAKVLEFPDPTQPVSWLGQRPEQDSLWADAAAVVADMLYFLLSWLAQQT